MEGLADPTPHVNWSEERIARERGRIRFMGIVGAIEYAAAAVVVAVMRGSLPYEAPLRHAAIPIVIACLVPIAYLTMKVFDGVLIMGNPRPTKPRAALVVRAGLTNLIGIGALVVFLLCGEVYWAGAVYVLGIPAALGILRRIGAYTRVMENLGRGVGPSAPES